MGGFPVAVISWSEKQIVAGTGDTSDPLHPQTVTVIRPDGRYETTGAGPIIAQSPPARRPPARAAHSPTKRRPPP